MRKWFLLYWVIIALPHLAFAQTRQITGMISDDKGTPLSGASVTEKGTNNGAVTDERGNFTLNVSNTNATLVVSYTGMAAQELRLGTSNTYNISLRPTGDLSEVVVTALGIRRDKKVLGYSTQEVK
ncbi:MAG: carboxypeptidase-like regulatory domain-containing protein, partial [Flavisolibacter sp.]|nr:carboxypeptidase-like regulatory domain-containing protein [Flavisolibacter sp.]